MRPDGIAARAFVGWVRGPEHPAKLRLVRSLGRRFLPAGGVIATVHPGVELYLDPCDWIEYLLLRDGEYEPRTLGFLEANLAAGDSAVFAGVNFGLHLIVAKRAVGERGRVVGFEPQPTSVTRAWTNLRRNGVQSGLNIVCAALGDVQKFVTLEPPPSDNSGAASLLEEASAGPTCTIVRLDEALQGLRVDRLRLLLLDVQGYEVAVLKGLTKGPLPELIVIEIDHALLQTAKTSAKELGALLEALGYELFDLNGLELTTQALIENNAVAVRRGCLVAWPRT